MIARRLDEIGVDYIEGGYPLSNEKDVEFFARYWLRSHCMNATLCAFGMTRRRGVKAEDDPGMIALDQVASTLESRWSARRRPFMSKKSCVFRLKRILAMIRESVQCLDRRQTRSDLRR